MLVQRHQGLEHDSWARMSQVIAEGDEENGRARDRAFRSQLRAQRRVSYTWFQLHVLYFGV